MNRAASIADLMLAGHRAWECLSVSEVLYVCEHEWVDVVVIAPDIEDPDFAEAQLQHFTIQLKADATSKDVIWQLSQLFPGKTITVQ